MVSAPFPFLPTCPPASQGLDTWEPLSPPPLASRLCISFAIRSHRTRPRAGAEGHRAMAGAPSTPIFPDSLNLAGLPSHPQALPVVLRAESLYQEICFPHETARVDSFLACILIGYLSFWSFPWAHTVMGWGQSRHRVAGWWHGTFLPLCHRGWGPSPAGTLVLHSLPSPSSPHSDSKDE